MELLNSNLKSFENGPDSFFSFIKETHERGEVDSLVGKVEAYIRTIFQLNPKLNRLSTESLTLFFSGQFKEKSGYKLFQNKNGYFIAASEITSSASVEAVAYYYEKLFDIFRSESICWTSVFKNRESTYVVLFFKLKDPLPCELEDRAISEESITEIKDSRISSYGLSSSLFTEIEIQTLKSALKSSAELESSLKDRVFAETGYNFATGRNEWVESEINRNGQILN